MTAFLLDNANYWPFAMFCIVLFMPFEILFPRITKPAPIRLRVVSIGVVAALSIGTSHIAQNYVQYGLITAFGPFKLFSLAKLELPPIVIFILSFLCLDFLIYSIHWLSHRINFLWRVHAIHHSDEHVTALSAVLHHPLETALNFTLVMFFSVILGVPILVLILYSFAAAAHNAFAHADIVLPRWLDQTLRYVLVTPDVHRTHHSVRLDEGNSNFGQILTIWDRIFGTYMDRPSVAESDLVMGLPDSEKPKTFDAAALLALPFAKRS